MNSASSTTGPLRPTHSRRKPNIRPAAKGRLRDAGGPSSLTPTYSRTEICGTRCRTCIRLLRGSIEGDAATPLHTCGNFEAPGDGVQGWAATGSAAFLVILTETF